jgi:ABC-2 type transport system permease protein
VTRAFAAEILKMRTTRTFFALVGSAFALTLLVSIAGSVAPSFDSSDHPGLDVLGGGSFAQIFALVIGLLAVTTEFRHGTITPTLLAVPDRARLVLAKLGAGFLIGLVLGVVCVGVGSAIGLGVLKIRDIPTLTDTSDLVAAIGGGILCSVLFCGIGVGLGAIIRNQVGAIIGVILWMLLVEPLLGVIPGIGHAITKFGLGGASNAVSNLSSNQEHTLTQAPGILLLVAYCAIFAALGTYLLRRRDISG